MTAAVKLRVLDDSGSAARQNSMKKPPVMAMRCGNPSPTKGFAVPAAACPSHSRPVATTLSTTQSHYLITIKLEKAQ